MRSNNSNITIRRLAPADDLTVAMLADLDAADAPDGPLLGAEVEGKLLAAISLRTGEVVADPFSRTAELTDLLELRVAQMRKRERPLRGRLLRRRSASAPAPAGQLVGLHPHAS
jgi:hypothetical protein